MKSRKTIFILLLLAVFVISACSGANQPAVDGEMAETKTMAEDAAMVEKEEMSNDEKMDESKDKMDGEEMMDSEEMPKDSDAMSDDHDMDDDEKMDDDKEMTEDTHMDGEEAMEDSDAMSDDHDMDEKESMSEMDKSAMSPAWFSAPLLNVNDGQTFTLDEFKDKVILVETMAMWCSNCLRQQQQVAALHEQLGERDDFVSVAVDIDINENADRLKVYTADKGFDWVYTVAPVEVAREIGQLYGDQFLNPPSTPMLIIDRDGEVHPLPFGIKSAADLQVALESFLADEM